MKHTIYLILLLLSVSFAQAQTSSKTASAKKDSVEKDEDDDHGYSIFPNPSSNFIKVKSAGAVPDAISVHDIAGLKLMEDKGDKVMNIYSLPRGIYYVYVRAGSKTEKIRFEKL